MPEEFSVKSKSFLEHHFIPLMSEIHAYIDPFATPMDGLIYECIIYILYIYIDAYMDGDHEYSSFYTAFSGGSTGRWCSSALGGRTCGGQESALTMEEKAELRWCRVGLTRFRWRNGGTSQLNPWTHGSSATKGF